MHRFMEHYQDRVHELESCEWDSFFMDKPTDITVDRILYIGDSISGGTFRAANKILNGSMIVDSLCTSKAIDNPFFQNAIALAGAQQEYRKAVLFNNGIHGIRIREPEYRRCYRDMLMFLREEFDGTPIVPVLTTFVAEEKTSRILAERNAVVRELAREFSMPVIDFQTYSETHRELLSEDGIHFTSDGYQGLAQLLIERIGDIC